MGAWGAGIFEDDSACDIRDEYLQLLTNGVPGPDATKQIINNSEGDADDPDNMLVFWTALAAIQWRCGMLESSVKEKALNLITTGDSPLWNAEEEFAEERKKVLTELSQQLNSPQAQPIDKNRLLELCKDLYGEEYCQNNIIEKPSEASTQQSKKWWMFWK